VRASRSFRGVDELVKSAFEILEILERRLQNDHRTELLEAAEEQRHIAHIRLKKWLDS